MSFHLKHGIFLIVSLVLLVSSTGFGDDHWGPCPASPAVVNPPMLSPFQSVLALRGEWDFVADTNLLGRHRMGKGPEWNEPDWSQVRTLHVPGCWEAQGVGEPGISETWDPLFDRIPRPINHKYMGAGRYRKQIDIPKDWDGKRVWLKVGGVRTEAWIWVNKKRVAHLNTFCGTYKYDITDHVVPGEQVEIIATVRNDSPSRKGCMAAYHRFGGFYRDIELEATPQTRIDDVWVQGRLDRKGARVHVSIRHEGNSDPGTLEVAAALATLNGERVATFQHPITLNADGTADLAVETTLMPFHAWTPENPFLYLAEVVLLQNGVPVHGWVERFGVRKLEVKGDRFYLNNEPFFMRGYGDDYIYPLTLISPPDREAHRKHLDIARRAGFNYVRHHTHCEIPEFFEAADEAGILIQPELPYYHDITTEAFSFDPLCDLQELYRHYRRYVSFASYCTGNEGHLGSPVDKEVYAWAKQNDPDRIMQHQDGGCNTPDNADYDTPNSYGGMATSIVPWKRGTFDALTMPFIAHEYLNLGIKMDPRTEPLFTGVIPAPRSMENYEASLVQAGLNRTWGDRCLRAAHGLQGYYQKQGIEQARLDPACDGYSYWTIIDVMVNQENTYTGQGFLNAFWEPKEGGLTPEEFFAFNGPTVLLADLDGINAVLTAGESVAVPLWISHFAAEPLNDAVLTWTLAAGGNPLLSGEFDAGSFSPGDVRQAGTITLETPSVVTPVKATLQVTVNKTDISNHWDFWLFPARQEQPGNDIAATEDLFPEIARRYPGAAQLGTAEAEKASLVIASENHPALTDTSLTGKRVLIIGAAEGEPNIKLGWWSLGNQLGTAFESHPLFGDFPVEESISPLWFRLIKKGMPLPLNAEEGQVEHIVIGEGRKNYFTYLYRQKQEHSLPRLHSHGLDLLNGTPEADSLLDNLLDYMRTDAFIQF